MILWLLIRKNFLRMRNLLSIVSFVLFIRYRRFSNFCFVVESYSETAFRVLEHLGFFFICFCFEFNAFFLFLSYLSYFCLSGVITRSGFASLINNYKNFCLFVSQIFFWHKCWTVRMVDAKSGYQFLFLKLLVLTFFCEVIVIFGVDCCK